MRRYIASRAISFQATNKNKVEQRRFREQNMVWECFVLPFVVSNFVRASKLSKAEPFGSFAGQVRRGSVNEFEKKNGFKNRVAQRNFNKLHNTHEKPTIGGGFCF